MLRLIVSACMRDAEATRSGVQDNDVNGGSWARVSASPLGPDPVYRWRVGGRKNSNSPMSAST